MPPEFTLRAEQAQDIDAITAVVEAAFRTAPHSDQTEHFIVQALRRAGALPVSLVAQQDGRVVGHVAFSPVQVADGSAGWYGLGPVAVLPALQGRGIGQALIHAGLDALRALGAAGCVVLGEPLYYGRFGFKSGQGCTYAGPPAPYFQSLAFGPRHAQGAVTYHAGFGAQA